jgi:hypothetical protein
VSHAIPLKGCGPGFGKPDHGLTRLNERIFGDCEVMNTGVSRFGTENKLRFYHYESAGYQPDLVLLLFFCLG